MRTSSALKVSLISFVTIAALAAFFVSTTYAHALAVPAACATAASPSLTLTQHVTEPDSGFHGDWATDSFAENVLVYQATDNTICAVGTTTGATFVTTGPFSPGAGVSLAAGITGTFSGGETWVFPTGTTISTTSTSVTLADNNSVSDGQFGSWQSSVLSNTTGATDYSFTYVTDADPSITWTNANSSTGDITNPTLTTVYVNGATGSDLNIGSSVAPFKTIQAAVNAVPDNGTVNVAAGTYDSFTVSGKNGITIDGAGVGSTIISPSTLIDTGVSDKYDVDMHSSVFVNNSTGITLEDMTIQSTNATPVSSSGAGSGINNAIVFWNSSSGTIKDSSVTGTYSISGAQTGQGIAVDASSGTNTLTIDNVNISGFQKNGIQAIDGNGSTGATDTISLTVKNGSITGTGSTGAIAQNGIVVWNRGGGSVSASVDGTTISNFSYSNSGATAAGILAYGSGAISSVRKATFANNQINVSTAGGSNNTIDATQNYWNSSTGPAIGTIDGETGTITYLPWYVDAAKTVLSNLASIDTFSVNSISGSIDQTGKTISVTVPAGTALTSLAPTVAFTGASVTPNSGAATNFSTPPVDYAVTSVDGSVTTHYAVTVKKSQTISVTTAAPSSATYGSGFTVAANSDSGLPVAITVSGGCSLTSGGSGSAAITMTSGTTACAVNFDQSGDATDNAATRVTENVAAQKASLTVTGITASSREYDADTDARINTTSATLVGATSSDPILLDSTHAVGTFSDKNVGTGKTVQISGLVTNANTNNYTLVQPTATANITKHTINGSINAQSKVYDGSQSATVTAFVTALGSDDLALTGTGNFSDKNVGIGKTVSLTNPSLTGTDAGNYALGNVSNTTANITAKSLTVSATGVDKTYDGTTDATVTLASTDEVNGDDLTMSYTSASYSDANVENNKLVAVSGISISGTDAGNYSLQNTTAAAVANIIPASSTVHLTCSDVIYNGAAQTPCTASVSGAGGLSQALSVDYSGNTNVGTASSTASYAGDSNHEGSSATVDFSVDPAPVTVTADALSKTYGQSDPTLTFTHDALQGTDTDSVFTGSLHRASGESVGTYAVDQGTLAASNYAITFVPANFTINADTSAASDPVATSTDQVTGDVYGTIPSTTSTTSVTTGGTLTVSIPAGTTVTGTSTWDGVITMPTATTTYTSPTPPSGFDYTVVNAIEVGAPDQELTFNKGVRLVFQGQSADHVGWSRNGVFTEISNICSGDSQAVGDALPDGGDCKYSAGADLVVWTKHFTTFMTFSQSITSGSNPNNGGASVSGGGGGGGGGIITQSTGNTGSVGSLDNGGGQVLGAATYHFTRSLTVGARGQDVIELQKILMAEGDMASSTPTGYFGALTKAAVVKYQTAHGITPASGYVGPKTIAILNQGSTPTQTDETKSLMIQSLQQQLQALLAKIAGFSASTSASTTMNR